MMLSDYDPNPLQNALTLYAANDEDKLRAHFDAMTSIQKEMFESQLFDNLYKNADFTTWYLENCASMGFVMSIGLLIKSIGRLRPKGKSHGR